MPNHHTAAVEKLLTHSVADLVGGDDLRAKLLADPSRVVVKYGVDPTRPDIHLGHAVCLRKLREFQQLGCRIVFLIGDFTALIGDPTGKNKLRPEVGLKEVHANMQTYTAQARKILDFENLTIVQNSTWFMSFDELWLARGQALPFPPEDATLLNEYLRERTEWETQANKVRQFVSLGNLIGNCRKVTHDQLIQRDMFQARKTANEAIYMNEMLYPILQGIDSLVIAKAFGSCDVELGGTDQYFNMLMGRQMVERDACELTPQAVITTPILEGTDGKEKMSKSLDNYISLVDTPADMLGKTLRIPDELIVRWVELTTNLDAKEFAAQLAAGRNPKELKMALAAQLVSQYHGEAAAQAAVAEFDRVHAGGSSGLPDEIEDVAMEGGSWNVVELLVAAKLVASKSDARRLIEGGGVRANGEKVASHEAGLAVGDGELILQVGKRRFARIVAG